MKKVAMLLGLALMIGCGTEPSAEVSTTSSALRFVCNPTCGWAPDLLPGARDVANGYSPAANEVLICTAVNYQTFCQAITVDTSPSVADLAPSGWYQSLRSLKMGSAAKGLLCLQTNFVGCATLHASIGYNPLSPNSFRSLSVAPN